VRPITTVRIGGLALIFGAIAFVAVFSFLAASRPRLWVNGKTQTAYYRTWP
jgi:hypothetical protein